MVSKDNKYLISFFLRLALASVFLYAAIASFLTPTNWTVYLPQWLKYIIPGTILLFAFSFYEIILSLWLLSGKKIYYASILSTVTLFLIIISNINNLDILFRDIAIFFSAISLAILSKKDG